MSLPKEVILDALDHIDPSDLDYTEWLIVGMALHHEGFDDSVWDTWSMKDTKERYKAEGPESCHQKIKSFRGSGNPVTAGTIIDMAKERGWHGKRKSNNYANYTLDFNDEISDAPDWNNLKGKEYEPLDPDWNQAEEIKKYLNTLFKPEESVRVVTGTWQGEDGKWHPEAGAVTPIKRILDNLEKYPEDIGYAVGTPQPEAGAWISINPLKDGIGDENVTDFRYALVEADNGELWEQEIIIRRMELPCAALVYSGKKSIHAVVKIGAKDRQEYDSRVQQLYAACRKYGLEVDPQNKNPSRLSRLPGVERAGKKQYLIDTNTGRASWDDWKAFVEDLEDELPEFTSLRSMAADPPPLADELIYGVLRQGHKMLISGPSKAGKSFALIELSIAIAEGRQWFGFQCRKGRVLYINLEIDPASCINRFLKVYEKLGIGETIIQPDGSTKFQAVPDENLEIWNLRGSTLSLDKLAPALIRRIKKSGKKYAAVIVDPIYKVLIGDENSASDMGAFCNLFDRICSETGASAIYCHHHSKGTQSSKKATDRASGSGVFSRDPDAQIDMIELSVPDRLDDHDGATAWRVEGSLREFPNFRAFGIWFRFPVHEIDCTGELIRLDTADAAKPAKHEKNVQNGQTAEDTFRNAYSQMELLKGGDPIKPKDLMGLLNVTTERSVRRYLTKYAELQEEFELSDGQIVRKQNYQNLEDRTASL